MKLVKRSLTSKQKSATSTSLKETLWHSLHQRRRICTNCWRFLPQGTAQLQMLVQPTRASRAECDVKRRWALNCLRRYKHTADCMWQTPMISRIACGVVGTATSFHEIPGSYVWRTALFSEARRGFSQTVYIRILHVTVQETITLPCIHVHTVHSRYVVRRYEIQPTDEAPVNT